MPIYGGCWLLSSDMHVPNQVGVKYDKDVELDATNDKFTCTCAVLSRNYTCGFPSVVLDVDCRWSPPLMFSRGWAATLGRQALLKK